jgi:hypothetical protein
VQPEEVLELIHSAPERYDTVRAALRYRSDGTTRRKIRERMACTEAGRRAFDISPREAREWMANPINHPEPDPSDGVAARGTPAGIASVWNRWCRAAGSPSQPWPATCASGSVASARDRGTRIRDGST